MNRWLSQPATRGEVIGWILTLPALAFMGFLGYVMVSTIPNITKLWSSYYPELAPPLVSAYGFLGQGGIGAIVAGCAVLPLLVLFSKQRPWVRIVAPLVCALIVWSLYWHYEDSFKQYAFNVTMLKGPAAAEKLPK